MLMIPTCHTTRSECMSLISFMFRPFPDYILDGPLASSSRLLSLARTSFSCSDGRPSTLLALSLSWFLSPLARQWLLLSLHGSSKHLEALLVSTPDRSRLRSTSVLLSCAILPQWVSTPRMSLLPNACTTTLRPPSATRSFSSLVSKSWASLMLDTSVDS
jgi:hypothetical protein